MNRIILSFLFSLSRYSSFKQFCTRDGGHPDYPPSPPHSKTTPPTSWYPVTPLFTPFTTRRPFTPLTYVPTSPPGIYLSYLSLFFMHLSLFLIAFFLSIFYIYLFFKSFYLWYLSIYLWYLSIVYFYLCFILIYFQNLYIFHI